MKKVLILLFSLSFLGLEAQVKEIKGARVQEKKVEKKQEKILPSFEGSIKIVNSDPKGFTGEFLVSGKKVASTLPGYNKEEVKSFIFNNDRTEILLQNQKGKKLAIKRRRGPMIMPADTKMKKGVAKVVSTGKKKTIGEYNCQEVTVTDNTTDFKAWVTTDIPLNMKDIWPSSNIDGQYISAVNSRNGIRRGMIMEATQRDIASGKSFTMTTQIEKKKVKEKEFKIPNGYKLVDQTRMSRNVKSISPGATVGSAQKKAAEAGETPATPTAPIKE